MAGTDYAANVQVQTLTLTNANQEYSIAFPAETKKFDVQARSSVDVLMSDSAGKVGGSTPAGPYWTIKQDGSYGSDFLLLDKQTMYFACASANVVLEFVFYT